MRVTRFRGGDSKHRVPAFNPADHADKVSGKDLYNYGTQIEISLRGTVRSQSVADFLDRKKSLQTEVSPDRTWVSLWAIGGCFDSELDLVGNSIDSFMEYALESAKPIYFHNLRFDGNFIIYWLHHGYQHYER